MGIIGFGMILYNDQDTYLSLSGASISKELPYTSAVDAIIRRKNGEICFGTYSRGI